MATEDFVCPNCVRKPEPELFPPPEPESAGTYVNGEYVPNAIPLNTRIGNIVGSVALMAYGAYGLWENDLFVPAKHGKGVHLHGIAAWVMYGAFIGACLAMLSVVVDHFDRRNNELQYKHFANGCKYVGIGLFVVSIVISFASKP